jgi:hypothetical protein
MRVLTTGLRARALRNLQSRLRDSEDTIASGSDGNRSKLGGEIGAIALLEHGERTASC